MWYRLKNPNESIPICTATQIRVREKQEIFTLLWRGSFSVENKNSEYPVFFFFFFLNLWSTPGPCLHDRELRLKWNQEGKMHCEWKAPSQQRQMRTTQLVSTSTFLKTIFRLEFYLLLITKTEQILVSGMILVYLESYLFFKKFPQP